MKEKIVWCVVVKKLVTLPLKYKESYCLQIPIQEAPRPLNVALLLFCHESCHFLPVCIDCVSADSDLNMSRERLELMPLFKCSDRPTHAALKTPFCQLRRSRPVHCARAEVSFDCNHAEADTMMLTYARSSAKSDEIGARLLG